MQKILKKTIQQQNRKSEKKEKRTKIKQNYNIPTTGGALQRCS